MKGDRGAGPGQWLALAAAITGLLVVQLAALAHFPLWEIGRAHV